ncbi:MAG: hypothetical protein JWN86_2232 [Planctomycetota bacterium]|nr:hypothetical protein [Planctomycetota bacterium]
MTVWRNASLAAFLWMGVTAQAQDQGSGPGYEMLEGLLAKAKAASDAGDTDLATKYASELLAKNTDKASWNYGNVVYEANEILGLAALKKGDMASAKRYLIAAGRTPGSPQFDSFGPEMTLAQRLLDKGEKETVLEFLDLVAKFWATRKPGDSDKFAELDRRHAATIEGWKEEIRAGGKPRLDRFGVLIPAWTYWLLPVIAGIFLVVSSYRGRQRADE